MSAEDCTDPEKVFDQPEDNRKYRFFNQPIELIPGHNDGVPQILVHRPNGGLQWVTIDQCLKVVTCMKLEASQLKVERRSIVVLKDFEIPDDTECDIELTDCESEIEE
jgi:hypothetical protein